MSEAIARMKDGVKVEKTRRKKLYLMEKRAEILNKRYPDNKYEVKEIETEEGMVRAIVRTAGTRPHKKKGEKK